MVLLDRPQHVIVGAGTAALLCASKLLERHDVVIIHDGSTQASHSLQYEVNERPIDWPKAAFLNGDSPALFWNRGNSTKIINYAQGHGFGGCSNVNALLWTEGCDRVYDSFWPKPWNSVIMKQ